MTNNMTRDAPTAGAFDDEAQEYAVAEQAHFEAIFGRHPNFVDLVREPGFNDFVVARGAQAIVDAGSADEINDLLDAYVASEAAALELAADACTHASTTAALELENPREARALQALLDGPVRRERLDRIAGVSNGPDVIYNLRNIWGFQIQTKRVPSIDRDQRKVSVGQYTLSESHRVKAREWLRARDPKTTPEDSCESDGGYVNWMKDATPEELRKLLPEAEEVELTEAELANPFIAVCFPQQ
jgi:hypothetical protein